MQNTKHLSDPDLVAFETPGLEEGRRRRIETHLATCPACRERLAGFLLVDGLLQERYPLEDDPAARGAILAAIRIAQKQQRGIPSVGEGNEVASRADGCAAPR